MEPITLPLPPTKTHQCREIHWQPTKLAWVGILTVTESAKPTTKVKVGRYLVTELTEQRTPNYRRFKFTKPGGEETHWVELGGRFGPICMCRGYEAFGTCRHIQALEALEKAGQLKAPQEVTI